MEFARCSHHGSYGVLCRPAADNQCANRPMWFLRRSLNIYCLYLPLSSTIDNDITLDDDMEERGRDAEDTYFDSESPCAAPPIEETMDSSNYQQI